MKKFLILRVNQGTRSRPGPGWEMEEFHFPVMTGKTESEATSSALAHLERSGKMPRSNFGVESHFAEWPETPEFIRPQTLVL